MSIHTNDDTRTRTGHLGEGTWWQGRSGLLVPLIIGAFSTYLLIGILTMDVAEDVDKPGPQFLPMIIMIAGFLLTILLTIAYIRNPEPVDVDEELPAEAEEDQTFSTPVTSAMAASRLEPHEEDEPAADRRALAEARAADSKHRTHSDFVAPDLGACRRASARPSTSRWRCSPSSPPPRWSPAQCSRGSWLWCWASASPSSASTRSRALNVSPSVCPNSSTASHWSL